MRMEWEKTDATADEAPGKAQAGEPTAAQAEEPGKAQAGEPTAARSEEPGAARAGEPTAAQAGEILKKAADTPSTVPGAAQAEKSAVDGRTRTEIPGAARAGEPGAARMDEAPAAQSGTDGQDLESEAAQPDVGGASQAATNAPAARAGESAKDAPAVQTGKTTAAQTDETTASQADESAKDAPAARAGESAKDAPAVQTGKPTAARTGEPTAAQADETTASQAGESAKDAPAARADESAKDAPAAQTGKPTAAQADETTASQADESVKDAPAAQTGKTTAARAGESFAAQSGGRGRLLWQLFFATLYISACTFGGGFVIVTFMRRRFVEQLHWLDEREMLDFTALAQSAPGAIAVNAAVLVGWRVAGFCGMLAAALGTVLPPMVILSVISLGYRAFADNRYVALALRGMQAGVAAVVLDVVCGLGGTVLRERSPLHIAVMAAAFVAGALLGANVVYVILAAALAGVGHALLRRRARGARP